MSGGGQGSRPSIATRWRTVLDAAGPSSARAIQRGRALTRRGAVEDLRIEAGRVRGSVRDDRVAPVTVELSWTPVGEETWDAAADELAGQVRSTAALLEGELPPVVEQVLAGAGVRLVPELGELRPDCTCTEPRPWCRHAVALHTAMGGLIDRDPSALLTLRGRHRDHLLASLRSGGDRGEALRAGIDLRDGLESARGDLDAISLAPAPVEDPAALLRHLGAPPGVDDVRPFEALLERAAAGAWRLAAGQGAQAADEELLHSELRAQRVASPATLAAALGRDEDDVRAHLDELYHAGAALRTGTGERSRYRASSG